MSWHLVRVILTAYSALASLASAAPFDDLRTAIDNARAKGGVVECDPALTYDFSRNVIELPSKVTIHGNGATFKSDKIPQKQGASSFFTSRPFLIAHSPSAAGLSVRSRSLWMASNNGRCSLASSPSASNA